jgi:6-phospho-3-hexuloisomerase
MTYIKNEKKILKEIEEVLEKNPEDSEKNLVKEIIKTKRIFLCGAGRSGLIARAFAMRLTQLGRIAFVIGESTTPSINNKDLLIIISGSGETKTILDIVKEAKKKKARIISISSKKNSSIVKKSDLFIELKSKTKREGKSIEPLGSLFEQSTLIFLDAVILGLIKKIGSNEKKMRRMHNNLE